MTIHPTHPFAVPEPERSPLRRFRGRMPAPVSVWAAASGPRRAGWTVSSFLVADGEPAELLGVLDPESDLADLLAEVDRFTVSLLGWPHRALADAFAGLAPAPGGPFRLADWQDTPWGPALADAPAWLGARLAGPPGSAGWGLLVRATVQHVELGPDPDGGILGHLRGRYHGLGPGAAEPVPDRVQARPERPE